MRPTKPLAALPATLSVPTPAQITAVTDVLEHRWSSNAIMVQDRLTQAIDRDDAASAQKWAIAGGISTEKVLLLKGRPTEIMGHFHAHRHELGPLVGKLARALDMPMGRVVEARVIASSVPSDPA